MRIQQVLLGCQNIQRGARTQRRLFTDTVKGHLRGPDPLGRSGQAGRGGLEPGIGISDALGDVLLHVQQVRPRCIPRGHGAAHGGGQSTTRIDRLVEVQRNPCRVDVIIIVKAFGDPGIRVQADIGAQIGALLLHDQIQRPHLMLRRQDRRVIALCQILRLGRRTWQVRQAGLTRSATGLFANRVDIFCLCRAQITTRNRQIGARTGQLRLGQCDVRPGHLTHFETIARGPQFLAGQIDVVLTDLNGFFLQQHAQIGCRGAEQDLLFDVNQGLPRRQHGFLRRLLAQNRGAAIIDQLAQRQAREKVRRAVGGHNGPHPLTGVIFADLHRPVDDRTQRRQRNGYIFIGCTQQGAVLFQQTAGVIGTNERICQIIGPNRPTGQCTQRNSSCQRQSPGQLASCRPTHALNPLKSKLRCCTSNLRPCVEVIKAAKISITLL